MAITDMRVVQYAHEELGEDGVKSLVFESYKIEVKHDDGDWKEIPVVYVRTDE